MTRRVRSYALTGWKSGPIRETFVVIGATFALIAEIASAMCAIFAEISVTPEETNVTELRVACPRLVTGGADPEIRTRSRQKGTSRTEVLVPLIFCVNEDANCAAISDLANLDELLTNPLEFDEMTDSGYYHPFSHLNPAGQRGPIQVFCLSVHVIPNLAVSAFTIPAKVAI